MTTLHNILGAVAVIALIGLANALATDAGEYAAPTPAEIEADIQAQRTAICNAEGWPDGSKAAYQAACRTRRWRST